MAYQLRIRLRAVAFIDLVLSGLSSVFFLVVTWFLASEIPEREVPMVVGIIGALIFVGLKSFGFWTCWQLITVINQYYQNDELNDLEQPEFKIAWNWLKTKVSLLIVPVLTFGFIIKCYRDCWICLAVGGGWLIVEVILISLGRVYMLRN